MTRIIGLVQVTGGQGVTPIRFRSDARPHSTAAARFCGTTI